MARRVDLQQLLGPQLLVHAGAGSEHVATAELLKGKTVLVYFSAHWCPPCRAFSPRLAETYRRLKAQGTEFEVVFVSSDRSEADFQEYWGQMPWAAVPHRDRAAAAALGSAFGVVGIPNLAVVSAEGEVLASNAVGAVMGDPQGAGFPWKGAAGGGGAGLGILPLLLLFLLFWWLSKWFTG